MKKIVNRLLKLDASNKDCIITLLHQ